MARKRWDFDDTSPASFAEVRRLIETAFNYKQFADSLTEPVRKQLLADLHAWNEATWEHRQHPPKTQAPE